MVEYTQLAGVLQLLSYYYNILNIFLITTVGVLHTWIWFAVATSSLNKYTGKASFYNEDYCSNYV